MLTNVDAKHATNIPIRDFGAEKKTPTAFTGKVPTQMFMCFNMLSTFDYFNDV